MKIIEINKDSAYNLFDPPYDYEYNINNNSKLELFIFNETLEPINIRVNLLGDGSAFIGMISSINQGLNNYNITVNHLNNNTKSNIINHAISTDEGLLTINVDGIVKKQIKNYELHQASQILTTTNGKGIINPNLYIDSFDGNASHSALVGNISEEIMFYLMTRGISKNASYDLYLKGFLLGEANISLDEKAKLIKKIKESRMWIYE